MKQWRFHGNQQPRDLKVLDVDSPVPKVGEVAVKIHAAALNYRDFLIKSGHYPGVHGSPVPLSDGAGEVIAVGEGVTQIRVGDRIATTFFPDWHGGAISAATTSRTLGCSMDGVLSEQAILPASAVVSFPAHLSYVEAATLPCAALTAWNALTEFARVLPGETVVLEGTGGVSTFALQFAKLLGAVVIQLSSNDAKLASAKELGADHLVNYSKTPDWDLEVREITNGKGADLVVDIGGAGTLQRAISATRIGGAIAAVGIVTGLGQIDPVPIIGNAIRFGGILVGSHEMYRRMARAIAANGLRPVIDAVFAFDDAPTAFSRLQEGARGKLVIKA